MARSVTPADDSATGKTATLATAPAIALFRAGIALQNEARWKEAASAFHQLTESNPGNLEIWCRLAACHEALKQWPEADLAYSRAIALNPTFAELRCNRGMVLLRLQRWPEAIAEFAAALAQKPIPEAWNGRGVAEKALHRFAEAEASFRQAIRLRPAYPEAHYNLGNTLQALEKGPEAIATYRQALDLVPASADVRNNLASALCAARQPAEAIVHLETILARQPDHPEAWNQLGTARLMLGETAKAREAFARAVALRPHFPEALCNLGNAWLADNELDRAQTEYVRAAAAQADLPAATFNSAIVHLLRGEYREGFAKYEARWDTEQKKQRRTFDAPRWTGAEVLSGKTILLHAEQGLGDTLQFVRYVPLLLERGARVVLEVQPPLVPLLGNLPGVTSVHPKHSTLPPFDLHCPFLSLPGAFGTEWATVPQNVPYLAPSDAARENWQRKLSETSSPRIGLVVSGNAKHKNDAQRSMALTQFERLISDSPATWFLVQKDLRPDDAAALAGLPGLRDLSSELTDFDSTAGVLANLDLLITVDTSVAHLAGALAVPTWVLVPFAPDWRWGLERTDSPWYPTMRLFRQKARGDWSGPLDAVSQALSEFVVKR